MCQTLKFSSCSSVHHARSCMIVKGIQAGGAGHPIRGCRISWLRKFKHSRYRHPRQKHGRDLWEIGAEALSKSESGVS